MSRPRRLNVFKPQPKTQHLGQQCELTIERLSDEGDGIARWNSRMVFVKGALPGERVSARIVAENRHGFTASLSAVVAHPNTQRVTPPCQHYAECGGCQVQHLDYNAQLAHKQRVAVRHLAKVVPAATWVEPIGSAPWHYRHRSRLQVALRGQSLTLGFRRQGSHSVTNIVNCLQWQAPLNEVVNSLRAIIARQPHANRIEEVQVAVGEGDCLGVNTGVQFWVNKGFSATDIDELSSACGAKPWLVEITESGSGKLLWSSDQLLLAYPGHSSLLFGPGDFTQANPDINSRLLSDTVDWLSADDSSSANGALPVGGAACLNGQVITEFFSGLGNFSLALAQAGGTVSGYEVAPTMVARAADRARQLDLEHVSFAVADLFDQLQTGALRDQVMASAVVLLDPPRAGARALCRQIGQWSAGGAGKLRRILYVSCNSLALTGDLEPLLAAGFRVERARVYDMFPHTNHFETMVLLARS